HEELVLQAHQSAEQIFRLRFQMKMGQNEGLKKLRELKKDIARIKTVERQRELGIATQVNATEPAAKRKVKKSAKKSAAAKGTKSKKAPKKTSTRNTKRTSKIAGKAKSAGKTKVKAAKRGKANAKKGGS
ncbi:MAG TPA: 50S ribosomal protein L29, partial [Acidobacteriaceae bacterium]|nr:50S ribosomal protein L29 [Acidobacteriaceae bacterium]